MSSDVDSVVAGTLAWCNSIREAAGQRPLKRLPRGRREDPESCPCGKATGLYVGSYSYGPSEAEQGAFVLPPAVQDFVVFFDEGHYPEYDEER